MAGSWNQAPQHPPSPTGVRLRGLAREISPSLAAVRSPSASPAGLHGAGRRLELALSGLPGKAREGDPAPVAGLWGRPRGRLAHDGHDHEGEHDEQDHLPAPKITPEQKAGYSLYRFGTASVKVGIEVLHFAVPLLLLGHFGASATTVSVLLIAGELAGMLAGWLGAPLIDRLGPPKVLAVTAALQGAAIGAIPVLMVLGLDPGIGVIGTLFVAGGALAGLFDISRRAGMPHILGRHPGTLREYHGDLYIYREAAGMGGDIGAGALVKGISWLGLAAALAYGSVLFLHPLSYAVAALLFFRLARKSPAPAAAAGEKSGGLAARFGAIFHGARIVLRSPRLLTAALVNIPVITLHKLFHTLLAAVYAKELLGDPALAAFLMLAWNAGEFVAAILQKKFGRDERTQAHSLLRYGAVVGLGAWLFWAFPSIWVAAPVAFLLATATLSNELGLASLFGAAVKKEDVGAVTGFVYPLASLFSLFALFGMGLLFDHFGATAGFLAVAVALSLTSVFYLLSANFLKKLPKEASPSFFVGT